MTNDGDQLLKETMKIIDPELYEHLRENSINETKFSILKQRLLCLLLNY